MSQFHDPAMVARYQEGPPKFVPGYADMQRMACVLLAERAPIDARVLVLGAGGGAWRGRGPAARGRLPGYRGVLCGRGVPGLGMPCLTTGCLWSG